MTEARFTGLNLAPTIKLRAPHTPNVDRFDHFCPWVFLPFYSFFCKTWLQFAFHLNNFWTNEASEKLWTFWESWMLQLSKDVSSFYVTLTFQKLSALKCFWNCQIRVGAMLAWCTNDQITLYRITSQNSDRHCLKAGTSGIPNMCPVV